MTQTTSERKKQVKNRIMLFGDKGIVYKDIKYLDFIFLESIAVYSEITGNDK
jgi:hypothetical protein